MSEVAASMSLFEIDQELDRLIEDMQEESETHREISQELVDRFEVFCHAHGEKVDRIGRFIRNMEAREGYCREEAARLSERARIAANKSGRTKAMVLSYLSSREMRKLEGLQFTLRKQGNSQASVQVFDNAVLPMCYRRVDLKIDGILWETVLSHLPNELVARLVSSVRAMEPDNDAIREAVSRHEEIPGAKVQKGCHLRVA